MLTINWLNHHEDPEDNTYIVQNFYNAYCMPNVFVENCFNGWDYKIHSPRNYPQSFMWILSLMNAVPQSIIHLKCFGMVSQKDEIICYRHDGRWNSFVVL